LPCQYLNVFQDWGVASTARIDTLIAFATKPTAIPSKTRKQDNFLDREKLPRKMTEILTI
jgi:hypothetical protein